MIRMNIVDMICMNIVYCLCYSYRLHMLQCTVVFSLRNLASFPILSSKYGDNFGEWGKSMGVASGRG